MQMMRPARVQDGAQAAVGIPDLISRVYTAIRWIASSLISELTIPEAKEFLKSGNVGGGGVVEAAELHSR